MTNDVQLGGDVVVGDWPSYQVLNGPVLVYIFIIKLVACQIACPFNKKLGQLTIVIFTVAAIAFCSIEM